MLTKFSTRQIILIAAAAIIFLMMLFPPFGLHYPGGGINGHGYHFIFTGDQDDDRAAVNTGLLAIQIVVASLIAFALWIAADQQK